MELIFYFEGLVIGFLIAAPIGPIGILCVNRSIAAGRASGFISGLGAVTADGFYCAVAAYGLTMISNFITGHQFWFRLVGGIFLFYLGARIFLSKPRKNDVIIGRDSLTAHYVSAFFLALANPVTILVFAGIFAALGLTNGNGNFFPATMMVAGVVSGSVLCWFVLSSWASVLRSRFRDTTLLSINRAAGSVIIVFAAMILATVIWKISS